MTYALDIAVIIFLILAIIWSIKHGFAGELGGATGWIITLLVSLRFGAFLGDVLAPKLGQIAYLSTFVGFIVLVLVLRFLFSAISRIFENNEMGIVDRFLSGVVGFIKGAFLLSLLLLLLSISPLQQKAQKYIEHSATYPYVHDFSIRMVDVITRFVPQIDSLYQSLLESSSKVSEKAEKEIQKKADEMRKRGAREGENFLKEQSDKAHEKAVDKIKDFSEEVQD